MKGEELNYLGLNSLLNILKVYIYIPLVDYNTQV